MKRFLKLSRGERGFTLIELLIVVAILGILAAVIIPNAQGFMITGTLNAANTEVANIKTASVGYMAEHGEWPTSTTDEDGGVLAPYISGTLKAVYDFDNRPKLGGQIFTADPNPAGFTNTWGDGIEWYEPGQVWERAGTTH